MTLTMTRVLQDDAHYSSSSNCYFQSAVPCCLVEERYRFLRWEGRKPSSGSADLDQSHTRLFKSEDQGATWSLLTEFDVPVITQWVTIFSPGGDRLLAGITDKPNVGPYDASHSFLPRSEDGGLTWQSSVSPTFYATFTGATRAQGFVKLPDTTTVLAFGVFDRSAGGGIGTTGWYNFLRSTDGGVTWDVFSTVDEGVVTDCVALSSTMLVCTGTIAGYYSTDGGASWNPGSGEQVLGASVPLGSGVVLANGRFSSLSVIWKSTDNGQNWANHASLTDGSGNRSKTLRSLTPTVLVAGTNTTVPAGDLQRWWLSEDGGDTWTVATIMSSQVAASDSATMTITKNGYVLAGVSYGNAGGSGSKAECWQGFVDGITGDTFTGLGSCETLPIAALARLRPLFDCVPVFSPPPCPPSCPPDPAQPVGLIVAPRPLPGIAFRSALYFLGLAQGTPAGTFPTVTLGLRQGCGATFATNNCAVAGC